MNFWHKAVLERYFVQTFFGYHLAEICFECRFPRKNSVIMKPCIVLCLVFSPELRVIVLGDKIIYILRLISLSSNIVYFSVELDLQKGAGAVSTLKVNICLYIFFFQNILTIAIVISKHVIDPVSCLLHVLCSFTFYKHIFFYLLSFSIFSL